MRAANIIGAVTALLMSAVMVLLGKPILSCFITGDTNVVEAAMGIGYHFLLVLAVFFPFLYILYVTRSCIQGMGNSLLPMISSMVQLLMRTGCALLLPSLIGESGVFFGEVCAWLGLICCWHSVIFTGSEGLRQQPGREEAHSKRKNDTET